MKNPSLDSIAARLAAFEETIILKLIDRAQYARNRTAYRKGLSGFSGEKERSLFELRLDYSERMDSEFGRFTVPEEKPFTSALPPSRRMVPESSSFLDAAAVASVNLTSAIHDAYFQLLEKICAPGDDGNYGSSVEHDVFALQAISRRIHYGAFYVAERKYRDNPDSYTVLINRGDRSAIEQQLTRKSVEENIIQRVGRKMDAMQSTVEDSARHRIEASRIQKFYHDVIIPLTKTGEVRYLLQKSGIQ